MAQLSCCFVYFDHLRRPFAGWQSKSVYPFGFVPLFFRTENRPFSLFRIMSHTFITFVHSTILLLFLLSCVNFAFSFSSDESLKS